MGYDKTDIADATEQWLSVFTNSIEKTPKIVDGKSVTGFENLKVEYNEGVEELSMTTYEREPSGSHPSQIILTRSRIAFCVCQCGKVLISYTFWDTDDSHIPAIYYSRFYSIEDLAPQFFGKLQIIFHHE